MKFQMKYLSILALSSSLMLSSCSDEQAESTPESQEALIAQYKKDIALASDSGLNMLVGEIAKKHPQLQASAASAELDFVTTDMTGKETLVVVRIPLVFKESLYMKKDLPEELDIMRKDINDAANKAMMPDASYLMQIGMPVDMLRDEDRHAKALPDNLATIEQVLLNETKGPVYIPMRQAGDVHDLLVNIQLESNSGQGVKVKSIDYEELKFDFLKDLVAESSLPTDQDIPLFTPEDLEARQKAIADGIVQFNEAAVPYINDRESAARALWTERQAVITEQEQAKRQAAFAAQRQEQELAKLYSDILSSGRVFVGEWKRDSRFGKLSLSVAKAELVENSIHFVGTLFDTDLPEASLDIVGHCELKLGEDGVKVDINIYDGQYDPDQATAEVYDAQDGVLRLKLDELGKLTGVMTCDSWKNLKDKDFTVIMSAPVTKSSE